MKREFIYFIFCVKFSIFFSSNTKNPNPVLYSEWHFRSGNSKSSGLRLDPDPQHYFCAIKHAGKSQIMFSSFGATVHN